MSKRRLIIRPGGIGDCILALPALEHLARTAEYTEIWVPRPVVPLVRLGQCVRAISSTGIELLGVGEIEPDRELMAHLGSFDHIVSWYGANRPEFRALVAADFHRALPGPEYRGHATDFFCEQIGAPIGSVPRIDAAPPNRRDALVIHPFSGGRRKNWPLDSFRQAAARWPAAVEWCAGPEEALDGAVRFGDLEELSAWLSGAAGYLGNDSGITHLAAALGVRTIAVFTTSDPAVWAPRGANVIVLSNPSAEDVSRQLERLWRASSAQSAFEPQ